MPSFAEDDSDPADTDPAVTNLSTIARGSTNFNHPDFLFGDAEDIGMDLDVQEGLADSQVMPVSAL